jgi:hypothetical protein
VTALVLNNDLVAMTWLRGVPAIAALADPAPVGSELPANAASWSTTGFYTVLTTGGSPHADFRLRRPVVTVFCWAVKVGSKKPPWEEAARLAEYVLAACYDETANSAHAALTPVIGGKTYPTALIKEINALAEPRKIPGDEGGYARYTVDVELLWVAP